MAFMFLCDELTDKVDRSGARAYAEIVMNALQNPHIERPQGESKLGEVARQYAYATMRNCFLVDDNPLQVLTDGHSSHKRIVLESFHGRICRVFRRGDRRVCRSRSWTYSQHPGIS